jgi:hypothetical protein
MSVASRGLRGAGCGLVGSHGGIGRHGVELNLVVRRPLLFGRAGAVVGLSAAQPVRDGLEFHFQRLNFLVLPKHHIAEFSARAFQKGDLGLDLFQRFVVHAGSVALGRRRRVPQQAASRRTPVCAPPSCN